MKKSYVVELNIFKKNPAFYGLQKILIDNFPGNVYILKCHHEWWLHAKKKKKSG